MEGLSHRGESDAAIRKAGCDGLAHDIADASAAARCGQHVGIRIDADDAQAALGERTRGDPGATADVRDPLARGDAGALEQPIVEGRRIAGSVAIVELGRGAETAAGIDEGERYADSVLRAGMRPNPFILRYRCERSSRSASAVRLMLPPHASYLRQM